MSDFMSPLLLVAGPVAFMFVATVSLMQFKVLLMAFVKFANTGSKSLKGTFLEFIRPGEVTSLVTAFVVTSTTFDRAALALRSTCQEPPPLGVKNDEPASKLVFAGLKNYAANLEAWFG